MTPSSEAMRSPMRRASAAVSGRMPTAGAVTSAHTPSTCTVEATGQEATSPEGLRARRAATSPVKGTRASARRGPFPHQEATSCGLCATVTPCPS